MLAVPQLGRRPRPSQSLMVVPAPGLSACSCARLLEAPAPLSSWCVHIAEHPAALAVAAQHYPAMLITMPLAQEQPAVRENKTTAATLPNAAKTSAAGPDAAQRQAPPSASTAPLLRHACTFILVPCTVRVGLGHRETTVCHTTAHGKLRHTPPWRRRQLRHRTQPYLHANVSFGTRDSCTNVGWGTAGSSSAQPESLLASAANRATCIRKPCTSQNSAPHPLLHRTSTQPPCSQG